jgi:alkanesulfonate monooxygenase SsuD/methylene tetrahydromethanopterin reductase-like flavin-dependent oxidoreductase (luciferase family)
MSPAVPLGGSAVPSGGSAAVPSGGSAAVLPPLAAGSVSLRLYPHDVAAVEQIRLLRAQARLGVEAGYDGVMVSEHHADFPGYVPNPVQVAGFLLDAMPSGWAAPSPLLLPMLPYALVAESVAWLAAAHPGRVGAGFAAGAIPVDFELAEVPFDEIVDRFKASLPKVVAALRGQDPGPLGRDRAVARCAEHPIPMIVAAQSLPAVRRAAGLGIGVLYDSLQTAAVGRRLSDAYAEAGGTGTRMLIRRLWVGDPPDAAMAAQMAHYRKYGNEHVVSGWGSDDQLIHGRTVAEAAERLVAEIGAQGADAVNVRVHLQGLGDDEVRAQLERHEDLPALVRAALTVAP